MSTRNLSDAVPALQAAVPLIIEEYGQVYAAEFRVLEVICVLRSSEEQWAIFKVGREIEEHEDGTYRVLSEDDRRILTKIDGRTTFSKHNPDPKQSLSKAVDFGVFIGGKYVRGVDEEELRFYYPLQFLAHKHGLRSGLDFPGKWKDTPHIEIPGPAYHP